MPHIDYARWQEEPAEWYEDRACHTHSHMRIAHAYTCIRVCVLRLQSCRVQYEVPQYNDSQPVSEIRNDVWPTENLSCNSPATSSTAAHAASCLFRNDGFSMGSSRFELCLLTGGGSCSVRSISCIRIYA